MLAGVDLLITPNLLIGITGGYERYNLDTDFNFGHFRGRAVSVGPYVGWRIEPWLVLDVWGGWAGVDYDIAGSGDSGKFDATRLFFSGNLTGQWRYGPWRIAPRVSIWYATENQESYVTVNGAQVGGQRIQLGRFSFGPEIGYRFDLDAWSVEPFGYIRGEYDFTRTAAAVTLGNGTFLSSDRFGARAGGGFNLAVGSFSLRAQASYDSIGRTGESNWGAQLRGAIKF